MMPFLLGILIIFFALNMGASNFSASFATACGPNFVSKNRARLLFSLFVLLGAVLLGGPVSNTLAEGLISSSLLSEKNLLIIVLSATISLYASNRLHVPQSTSFVTVAAITGVGAYHGALNQSTYFRLFPFWILFPVAGYLVTYLIGKMVYPPNEKNYWIYEKLVNNHGRLKFFVIFSSCYNAFSVGTSNVANVAGPLIGGGYFSPFTALALLAPLFGIGTFMFTETLNVTSKKIIPLGPFTSTIICFVAGSLVIIASVFGIPMPFVMVNMAAIFAVSALKKGQRTTLKDPITQKTLITWIVAPIIAFSLAFLFSSIV